jgi:hypothetical protein
VCAPAVEEENQASTNTSHSRNMGSVFSRCRRARTSMPMDDVAADEMDTPPMLLSSVSAEEATTRVALSTPE